jgi:hypothetical protein
MAFLFLDRQTHQQRVFKDRVNPLNTYTDKELIARYRFDRASLQRLCDFVDPYVRPSTSRSMAIGTEIQVSIVVKTLLHAKHLSITADVNNQSCFHVSGPKLQLQPWVVRHTQSRKKNQ